MQLKPGDFVKVVDEDLSGEICAVDQSGATLRCADGFEYRYALHQLILVKKNGETSHQVNTKHKIEFREAPISVEDSGYSKYRSISFSGSKASFDLHLEDLAPSEDFRTNHEALEYQLAFVERVISEAKRKRVRNFIFIHGLGAGKLRKALRQLLADRHPEIEFFDADYQQFGAGATELIIHGLGKA